MLKKLLLIIVTLAMILVLLIWGIVHYVKPEQTLDLHYDEVSVVSKMLEIVQNRKLVVQLTEQDINNLVKKQLSKQTVLPHQMEITGAQFKLKGDQVEADVNLLWNNKVSMAATLFFQLAWNSPNLEITHTSTQIKQFNLPIKWFHMKPIQIPLEENLPKLIAIKEVAFQPDAISIRLKLR